MSDIFISYASEDRPRAQMLAEALERYGWSTFWDRTIPIGKTWRETIGKELNDARCVIVLWSKTSIQSGWVQEEADDATRRGVLVPILIENVQPPIGFRSIQAAHLENWDGTEPTQGFRRLIADIAALIGPPPKEVGKEGRLPEAEVERKAEEERKRAEKKVGRVPSEQPKTAAISSGVPWRIIAGSAIILPVIAVVAVAVWQPRPPVTPQPAPPVTSQPAPPVRSALEPYETAAAKGDASAMFNLGLLYENGQGVAQDYAKAREWYEKAAANDNASAMFNLGLLYARGDGVAQDYAKAHEWYEKAAAKGDAEAMFNLGLLYARGSGVARDYAKAREWYEKAAAEGDAPPCSISACFTTTVAAWRRITPRRASGTRRPPPRATARAMSNLGRLYENGRACRRTTPRRASGTRRPPPRATATPRHA